MRIDFHVHSKYSKRPSQWLLQKINCPESFTDPLRIYRMAQKKGMTAVTISDHNSIDGAMEIAHLPGAFISEEVTTYFPEDGCKLHVLALNIREEQHEEIQRFRRNVFDLVDYLNQENILHVVAHPLYSINGRLTPEHVEKLFLLFKNFELNGSRNHRENQCLKDVLNALTPETIARLADKHDMQPRMKTPWIKHVFAGSDDHSSLNIARAFTEIEGIDRPEDLTNNLDSIGVSANIRPAIPLTMAHNLYGIAYQFYRNRFNLDRYTEADQLIRFLDRSLIAETPHEPRLITRLYGFFNHRKRKRSQPGGAGSMAVLLRHEIHTLLADHPDLLPADGNENDSHLSPEERWFDFVNQVCNRVLPHIGDHLINQLSGANLFSMFNTIGSAAGFYALLAPYFIAYSQFAKDRELSNAIHRRFSKPAAPDALERDAGPMSVAHFTDTFYDVNGVALTLRQSVRTALKNGKDLTIITCNPDERPEEPGICNFKPIGVYGLPEYAEQQIYYPPVLEMLNYCYERGFAHIHTATPGPIGLAALAVARILKLPISGTYHTSIPQYAQILTGDEAIGDLSWKFILWYYDQLDTIYAPSKSTMDELIEKGIAAEKIRVYPRGIDTERFHPSKRNGFFKNRLPQDHGIKMLYVGRVSKEKNLHLLADAFRRLVRTADNVHLVVVGDGPYLEEMKAETKELPCSFTGYMDGEDLASAYASSDIFVFPSATDTFGNVVLEAQASGLPVIITEQGGPVENVLPDRTGLVVKAGDVNSLHRAMVRLVSSHDLMRSMGSAARHYMEERSFDAAFMKMWDMYQGSTADPAPPLARAS